MKKLRVIYVPSLLHPVTIALVERFAEALAEKMHAAEVKRAFTDAQLPDDWTRVDWESECRADLLHHVAKGDPRDVAAYCAFMWHHGWQTAEAPPVPAPDAEQICPAFAEQKKIKFTEGLDA